MPRQPRTRCKSGQHALEGENVYTGPDGKRQCRPCRDARQRIWHAAYYKQNADKLRAYSRRYRQEHKEQEAAYQRDYYRRNRERRLAYVQEWRRRKQGSS